MRFRMFRVSPGLLFVIISILVSPALYAENIVLEGEEVWHIVLTPRYGTFSDPYAIRSYENSSNKQSVLQADAYRIVVERHITYKPVNSSVRLSDTGIYAQNSSFDAYLTTRVPAEVAALADNLAAGVDYQVEFVSKVLDEVRERLVWKYTTRNTPAEVLKNNYGTCEGFATLTAALLRAKGIPARYVVVETLKHPSWAAGPHGEIEVYYDDIGWVSYDPQKHRHHAPMPRIWLGNDSQSQIYSTNVPLWRGYKFFRDNDYYVEYTKIRDNVEIVSLIKRPRQHEYFSSPDNSGTVVPHIIGEIQNGSGKPLDDDWIFYSLEDNPETYEGSALDEGNYIIGNDNNGGMLYYNEKGYVIWYYFDGYTAQKVIRHDVTFTSTDSIVLNTGKPDSSVRFNVGNVYYTFKTDKKGIIRIHTNIGTGRYAVNGTDFVFYDGKWRKE